MYLLNFRLFLISLLLSSTMFIARQADAQPVEVGSQAPDLILPDTKGDTVRLSDLRGQMVLIDFWASWCVPCRKKHPELKEAYAMYKDRAFKYGQGFTVYSISLDHSKAAWQKAIEKDQLPWPYQVSDLKGWKSKAAKTYGVKSIPATFLIDGNGIIAAMSTKFDPLDIKRELSRWVKD